jgi:hypothetical protein
LEKNLIKLAKNSVTVRTLHGWNFNVNVRCSGGEVCPWGKSGLSPGIHGVLGGREVYSARVLGFPLAVREASRNLEAVSVLALGGNLSMEASSDVEAGYSPFAWWGEPPME